MNFNYYLFHKYCLHFIVKLIESMLIRRYLIALITDIICPNCLCLSWWLWSKEFRIHFETPKLYTATYYMIDKSFLYVPYTIQLHLTVVEGCNQLFHPLASRWTIPVSTDVQPMHIPTNSVSTSDFQLILTISSIDQFLPTMLSLWLCALLQYQQ